MLGSQHNATMCNSAAIRTKRKVMRDKYIVLHIPPIAPHILVAEATKRVHSTKQLDKQCGAAPYIERATIW